MRMDKALTDAGLEGGVATAMSTNM
jgi:hypothetical protein